MSDTSNYVVVIDGLSHWQCQGQSHQRVACVTCIMSWKSVKFQRLLSFLTSHKPNKYITMYVVIMSHFILFCSNSMFMLTLVLYSTVCHNAPWHNAMCVTFRSIHSLVWYLLHITSWSYYPPSQSSWFIYHSSRYGFSVLCCGTRSGVSAWSVGLNHENLG